MSGRIKTYVVVTGVDVEMETVTVVVSSESVVLVVAMERIVLVEVDIVLTVVVETAVPKLRYL